MTASLPPADSGNSSNAMPNPDFDPQVALDTLRDTTAPMPARMQGLLDILHGTSVDALMALLVLFEKESGMEPDVRQAIAITLGEWGSESATELLMATYHDDAEPKPLRLVCLQSLAKTKHTKAIDLLMLALQDEDNDVFGTASDSLQYLGHDIIPELRMMLEQGTEDIRCVAAWHLGKLKNNLAIPSLVRVLDEYDGVNVLALCVWALGEIGEARPEILDVLKKHEEHEAPEVYIRARDALTKLKRNLN